MLAVSYLAGGLIAVVGAVWLLAGAEWALLAAGLVLCGLAVLERRGAG